MGAFINCWACTVYSWWLEIIVKSRLTRGNSGVSWYSFRLFMFSFSFHRVFIRLIWIWAVSNNVTRMCLVLTALCFLPSDDWNLMNPSFPSGNEAEKRFGWKGKKKMFILFFVFSFIITRQFKDQTPPKTKKLKKKNFFLSFSSKWLGTLEATWPPNVQCRSQPENKIKLGNGLPSSQPAGPAQFLFLSFYDISLNLSWYLAFECRVLSSSSSKLPQLRHLCFYSSDFTAYKNTRTPVHGLGREMWSCLLLYRLTV